MSANDVQVGGDHYKAAGKTEHWDFVHQHDLDYFQGQITKYVVRWRKKGGIQDLKKAQHFLEKYIELEVAKVANSELQAVVEQRLRSGAGEAAGGAFKQATAEVFPGTPGYRK